MRSDQFTPVLNQKLASRTNSSRSKVSRSVTGPPLGPRFAAYAEEVPIRGMGEYLAMERTFDAISATALEATLCSAGEQHFKSFFQADAVTMFCNVANIKILYSPSSGHACPHGAGLIGYCYFSQSVLRLGVASNHVSFDRSYDGRGYPADSHLLVFPLFDGDGVLMWIVQVSRGKTSSEFGDRDERAVQYFQQKFRTYAGYFTRLLRSEGSYADYPEVQRIESYMQALTDRLTRHFHCNRAEVWRFVPQTNEIVNYNTRRAVVQPFQRTGIAGYAMLNSTLISVLSCDTHPAYDAKVDGAPDSLLIVPIKHPRSSAIYGLVLRGKRTRDFFTERDQMLLSKIAPQIVLSLTSSEGFEAMAQDLDRSRASAKRNLALLQVAECLSGQLHIDALMPDIMKRGCALVDADRCSLFIVDESRGKLVTSFHGGLANAIEIPMNAGIVGYSATTGRVTNIPNAYEDPRFNRETDRATGYRTETLLCVPIVDQHGGIRGVTEMINKRSGTFTVDDEEVIQTFNIFVGISVENARLYQSSIDLSMQLKGILEISQSITQSKTTKRVIADLLKDSRKVIGAASATVHLWDNANKKLEVFAVDEDACLKAEAEPASGSTAQSRRTAIRKILRDGRAPELQNEDRGNLAIVQRAIAARESNIMNHETNPKQSLIVVPIVGSARQILGALMMQWKKRDSRLFTVEDLKLLEGFAVFVGISIEKSQSDTGVSLSPVEIAIRQAMSESERMHERCPIRLSMTEQERADASSAGFSALDLDETQLAKVGFWIFDTLGIREEYPITNETLFAFLFRMKELHSGDVNTGWRHAIGIAQMLVYTLLSGHAMQQFTKLEKLAIVVSLLSHDVGLGRFVSESSRNTKTFLKLTAADVSMKERFHATVLVNAVSDAQANLFAVLKQEDLDSLLGLILDLMHSVNLAKHFEILDQIDQLQADRNWFQSGTGRILFMKLLVKSMVVSDLARPIDYASLFKDQIVESFFDTADLSRCYGMMYTADEKKRENLDRDRSQVAMITYVLIPLLNRIAQCIPVLGLSVEQVRHNLRCFTCDMSAAGKEGRS